MNTDDRREVKIVFADKHIKNAYEKLKTTTTEDKQLYIWLNRVDVKHSEFRA